VTDLATTERFFTAWLAGATDGWVSFRHLPVGGDRLGIRWAPATDLGAILAVVEELAPHGDLWFGVGIRRENLGPGRRGGAADVAYLPGLWLDIDIEGPGHQTAEPLPLDTEDALDLLVDGPAEPSLVVHSGGGIQPYWLWPEPLAPNKDILAAWHRFWAGQAAERGWALDNVSDIAREMRVPGSSNWKTGEPRPVTIL